MSADKFATEWQNAGAANAALNKYAGSVAIEVKPLEDITRIADDLQRQADALDAYLERFNGPAPAKLGNTPDGAVPPSCYRSELDRLDALVRRIGSITDLITRLG